MSTSLATSMQGLQVTGSHPTPKVSSKDWHLPTSFLSLLPTPPHILIPSLVPSGKPAPAPKAHVASAPKPAEPKPSWAAFIPALQRAPDTLTNKGAEAYTSTSDPLVDLFFELTPGVTASRIYELVEAAWAKDSLTTLKLIFQTRSIHEGKGWREGFYQCLAWVWEYHPHTLLSNLHLIVEPTCERQRDQARDAANRQRKEEAAINGEDVLDLDDEGNVDLGDSAAPEYPPRPHGSFKDLIELLKLHVSGELTVAYKGRLTALDEGIAPKTYGSAFKESRIKKKKAPSSKRDRTPFRSTLRDSKKVADKVEMSFKVKLMRAPTLHHKYDLLVGRAEKALQQDKKFQALFITVLHIFVKYIKEDLALLDKHQDFLRLPAEERAGLPANSSPHLFGMSYAAKWTPTPGHSADKQTLFASGLARLLFPNDPINWARQRLQKEVLSPLRKVLAIPEVAMSNGSWRIDYPKVPSKSMARNAVSFAEHDPKGFEAYLERVASGRSTVSGAGLMPHEIVYDAVHGTALIQKRLADLQWKAMVNAVKISSKNRLDNCVAIADVSGSMGSIGYQNKQHPSPILPCIALTLLLGELAVHPWSGSFFTFSSTPTFETIDISLPISERVNKLSKAHWEMSTNFFKVFDMILSSAKREKLTRDQMVKKLFVFSDMQFDAASDGNFGETEHQTIQRKFDQAGYPMPEIVYWNLAAPRKGGTPKPVRSDVEGVSLFSGFSGSLMKFFLGSEGTEEDDAVGEDPVILGQDGQEVKAGKKEKKKSTPIETVMKVASAQSLSGLRVVD
ncbi:hypothetical protein IAU59_000117 [Kwoniella sp. CBS 9459]